MNVSSDKENRTGAYAGRGRLTRATGDRDARSPRCPCETSLVERRYDCATTRCHRASAFRRRHARTTRRARARLSTFTRSGGFVREPDVICALLRSRKRRETIRRRRPAIVTTSSRVREYVFPFGSARAPTVVFVCKYEFAFRSSRDD